MTRTLTTKRLILRAPCSADAASIARYLNNFAVAGNLGRVPYPYALADAERWLTALAPEPDAEETSFAIELPGAGYIGAVGLHHEVRTPTLGYWLAEPFWHRGFMTEAAAAVVTWYFGLNRSDVIYSGVFHFNKASLAVQKKLGFVETDTNIRRCLARGEDVRHIDTALSREQWQEAPIHRQQRWAASLPDERAIARDSR